MHGTCDPRSNRGPATRRVNDAAGMTSDDQAAQWLVPTSFALAVLLPLMLAPSVVPDAVFLNQAAACLGWGVVLCLRAVGRRRTTAIRVTPSIAVVQLGLAALAVLALVSQPSAALVLVAAALLVAGAMPRSPAMTAGFAWAWWAAGMVCVVVGLVQYFAPSLADGWFVATNGSPGRAVGNMRQPNHLATALLCAMVWTAWLARSARLRTGVASVSIAVMVFGIAMSASRTGALSLAVLVVWAIVDRTMPRNLRVCLAATPVIFLVAWGLLAGWGQFAESHFYGADRLQSSTDISSSRFAIWRNSVSLIAQHPWFGVGWGNFNFAWTYTPFPDRPVAFFDHTHNLLLQLAVEIGIPATLFSLALIVWAIYRARAAWQSPAARDADHPGRAVLAMMLVLAVHSLLEYPLWYAYFLFPAAWALGLLLGEAAADDASSSVELPGWLAPAAGVLFIAGAAFATWDHRRVEVIFTPPVGAAPLAERIVQGQRSTLFGHHADYAAVTTPPRDQRLETFQRPLHQLVDVRLMIATIEALEANGQHEQALYAAQRLREFRRSDAQAYFKDCDAPEPPFQCERTPVAMSWRDIDRATR